MAGRERVRGAEDAEENLCLAPMGRGGGRELLRILEEREGIHGRSSKVEILDKYFCCRPVEQPCYVSVSADGVFF